MKKLILITILCLIVFHITYGQDTEKYKKLIKEAYRLYENKEFLQSGQTYSEAFVAFGGNGMINDRYNAACSWALASQADSAFVQLFILAEKAHYKDLGRISVDTDLNSLQKDNRWGKIIEIVTSNKNKAEANLDKPLVAILDTVFIQDQKYRLEVDGILQKFGRESDEFKACVKTILRNDSINLIKVKKILDERGWLGANVIGNEGNNTLFAVIQHADPKTQEKYLPMMRDAVKKGNARAKSLALLEDRVAIYKGEKQIYGTQILTENKTGISFIAPLIDPDNVDKRRSEVGLGSLEDYVLQFGITWNVEEYKKKLPEYEAKLKQ